MNEGKTSAFQGLGTLKLLNGVDFKVLTAPSYQKVVRSDLGLLMTCYQALKHDPTQSVLKPCLDCRTCQCMLT